MTKYPTHCTRRAFSKGVLGSAAALAAHHAFATGHTLEPAGTRFAYIGFSSPLDGSGVHVFDLRDGQFDLVQTITAAAPAHLELNSKGSILYCVHAVGEWDNLPRGAVSAYAVDAAGKLNLLHTQPLSLSATFPQHATLTGDQQHLVVASGAGGIYNVLPIDHEGRLQAAISILKEVGFSNEAGEDRSAKPGSLALHIDRRTLISADVGIETMTTFQLKEATLSVLHRRRVHAGSGPSQVLADNTGKWLYALHAKNGSISVHPFDSQQCRSGASSQRVATKGAGIIATHPTFPFLISASPCDITVYGVDSSNGHLVFSGRTAKVGATHLRFNSAGTELFAANANASFVSRMRFDAERGSLTHQDQVTKVRGVSSVALLTI